MLDKQSEDFTKLSIKQYEKKKYTDLQTEHKNAIECLKSQHAEDVEDLKKDKILIRR